MNPMRLQGGGVDSQRAAADLAVARLHGRQRSGRVLAARGRTPPARCSRWWSPARSRQGITYSGTRQTPQVSLPFADDGGGADPVPNDGAFAGVLAPAQTGLAGFAGTIRTQVSYTVNGKNGMVVFDVIYTPELPAVWTGQIREAVENGSLNFYLRPTCACPGATSSAAGSTTRAASLSPC
jgi:hypothetical protein